MFVKRQLSSRATVGLVLGLTLCLSPLIASAQRDGNDRNDRNDRSERNWDGQRFTRLDPGMTIRVRTTQPISTGRTDYQVFNGIVDQDVPGEDGRVAIPRGSMVELIVRRERGNQVVLDLESIAVNGQRYGIDTDPKRVVGTSGNDSLVGSIVGAIQGGRYRGRDVRIPRNTVMNFRLERSLLIGVSDRGIDRNGRHFHDDQNNRRRN